MSLAPGVRLGAYEVVALIGAGGMGEVYRARDPRLGRDVAIKVLPSIFSADPDRVHRFEQEARAAAALNSPNILAIHDIGQAASTDPGQSTLFIVSELLEGEPLNERLKSGPLPVRKAIDYAVQIARGLAVAHEKGIVHRDLKPANIFIASDGRVKILDFGLAKLVEREPVASGASMMPTSPPDTSPGMVLGTVGYMSPEQVRGRSADHRSDIFAFGAMLYEMLSGRRAFHGDTSADTMTAILKEDPADLPSAERHIPFALERIVDRCVEKNPAARFQSAGDLAFALDALSGHSSVAERVMAAGPMPKRRLQLAWMLVALLSVALVAVLATAAVTYFTRVPPSKDALQFTVGAPEGWSLTVGNLRLALSPDGRRLAFVARSMDGKQMLWVRALDTLTPQMLSGTEGAINPFWSPDSRFVAFSAGGKLQKIDVTGGPPIVLCNSPASVGGAWSSEGVIIFGTGNGPLQRVPSSGGIPAPAADLRKDEGPHSGPSFLPDGRHFIFSVAMATKDLPPWANYIGMLDSMERTRIPNATWPKALYSDGHVLFPREATMMAQPFDLQKGETTGEAFPVAEQIQTLPNFGVGIFSVSATGVLAYQAGVNASANQLSWVDRTGKNIGATADQAVYSDLQLSPDARRASVSVVDPSQRNRDIWIVDLARGLRTRFTFDAADELTSAWSPDGGMVAFNSRRKGRLDLYEKASSGAGEEKLVYADNSDKSPLSWSADGKFLLFASGGSETLGDLWVLPLSGDRRPIPIANSRFDEGPGKFSPDGRWIAYRSNESGRGEVYVAPFPGPGGKWQVSMNGGSDPRWRADGKEIFYPGPDNRIMAAAVSAPADTFDVGMVGPLFSTAPGGPRSFYDVSPDGKRFLLNTTGATSAAVPPITVVVNWLSAAKR